MIKDIMPSAESTTMLSARRSTTHLLASLSAASMAASLLASALALPLGLLIGRIAGVPGSSSTRRCKCFAPFR